MDGVKSTNPNKTTIARLRSYKKQLHNERTIHPSVRQPEPRAKPEPNLITM